MRVKILLAVIAMVASIGGSAASAGANAQFETRTERLFISAGCPQDTPGTCTSTRWLGKTPGNASSNFITAITPADEATYRATGAINWRDYAADSSVRAEGYRLIGGSKMTASVLFTAQGVGVNSTAHARITGSVPGSFTPATFTAPDQTILTTLPGSQVVTFTFDVPAAMDGKVITAPKFEVAIHGIHAAAGYIDQQGGSTVSIPHLVPIGG